MDSQETAETTLLQNIATTQRPPKDEVVAKYTFRLPKQRLEEQLFTKFSIITACKITNLLS